MGAFLSRVPDEGAFAKAVIYQPTRGIDHGSDRRTRTAGLRDADCRGSDAVSHVDALIIGLGTV